MKSNFKPLTPRELDSLLRPIHRWYWPDGNKSSRVYPSFRAYYGITTRYMVCYEIGASVVILEAFRKRAESSQWRGWVTLIPTDWSTLKGDSCIFGNLREVDEVPLTIQIAAANAILTLSEKFKACVSLGTES